MAHHNTVRRYPPVDYYDACQLYDRSGEQGRFSARSAGWSLGD